MADLPYTIQIRRDDCMGSGICVIYASKTFDIDDEAKSRVLDPAGDPLEQIQAAAAGCPTSAIEVRFAADAGA